MQLENYFKFAIFIILLSNVFYISKEPVADKAIKIVALIVYAQVALIILGYFYAGLTEQIANLIGFHIRPEHQFALSRQPFDPWKRSFSIFDNPNVAGRLLFLTFIYFVAIAPRIPAIMLIFVILASIATGSRAALLLIFCLILWGSWYHKSQRKMFKGFAVTIAAGVVVVLTSVTTQLRVLDLETLLTTILIKVKFAVIAFYSTSPMSVYDTDVALIYHQFGSGGLMILSILFAQTVNPRNNLSIFAYAYCLSGSLIFSTPNIAALLIFKILRRFN